MKNNFVYLLLIVWLCLSCKEQVQSQVSTHENVALATWNKEAETNIRLWPKYNNAIKSEQQLAADITFIESELSLEPNRLSASNKYITIGFEYLYRKDIKTAMYRFNQAYLLDTTNVLIYWGYGAVYMQLYIRAIFECTYMVRFPFPSKQGNKNNY